MSKKALCIGINDYPGTQNDLSLRQRRQRLGVELAARGFTVTKLIDAQATLATLRAAIGTLVKSAISGDSLTITYLHGTWLPDSSGDNRRPRRSAVSVGHQQRRAVARRRDQRVVCGARRRRAHRAHFRQLPFGHQDARPRRRPRPWPPARALHAARSMDAGRRVAGGERVRASRVGGLKRSGGDLLLAGCLDTQYSWDTSFKGRGRTALFTYYALKTLREKNWSTYAAWFKAIRTYLPSSKLPQDPQILGSASACRFKVLS